MRNRMMLTGTVLLALACSDSASAPTDLGTGAWLRVFNTAQTAGALRVQVDDQTLPGSVSFGTVSDSIAIAPGSYTVRLIPSAAGRSAQALSLTIAAGAVTKLVAIESTTVIIPQPLTDTGLVAPPDKSRLRVAHLAGQAPDIAIARIQPDYPDPVSVMFPFAYGAVSPYIQSTPGNWWVIVTDSTPGDTLLKEGPISIPAGEQRTVVIMDKDSTSLQALILDP